MASCNEQSDACGHTQLGWGNTQPNWTVETKSVSSQGSSGNGSGEVEPSGGVEPPGWGENTDLVGDSGQPQIGLADAEQPASSDGAWVPIQQTPAEEPPTFPPGQSPDELERKHMLEEIQDWPWRDVPERLVTLGPWIPNEYRYPYNRRNFALFERDQTKTSPLFSLLGVDVINQKIMGWVLRDHFDATNFALTCQSAFFRLKCEMSSWDMSDGWFGHCDRPQRSFEVSSLQGSVKPVLIVTPVRHPRHSRLSGPWDQRARYTRQTNSLLGMFRAMINFGDFLNTVHMHRVPFLTVDVLSLLVPTLRNLKVLGVYKCQLIHIGDTIRLLDIVKAGRPLGGEDQVYLDFFPNYHVGPKTDATGSYGVLWDDWKGDTRLAIWQLASRILPRAFAQGIDMTKPGTAFRKWLEMSPCWNVEETIQVIMTTNARQEIRVPYIDYPRYKGNVEKFMSKIRNRPEGWKWATEFYKCYRCKEEVLGIFYHYNQIRDARNSGTLNRPDPDITCLGCMLVDSLCSEQDHYKSQKREIVRRWLLEENAANANANANDVFNTTDIPRALDEYQTKGIARDVRHLERLRFTQMNSGPEDERVDHELAERQRPLTRADLGKRGRINPAPQVGGYDRWLVQFTLTPEERVFWDWTH